MNIKSFNLLVNKRFKDYNRRCPDPGRAVHQANESVRMLVGQFTMPMSLSVCQSMCVVLLRLSSIRTFSSPSKRGSGRWCLVGPGSSLRRVSSGAGI